MLSRQDHTRKGDATEAAKCSGAKNGEKNKDDLIDLPKSAKNRRRGKENTRVRGRIYATPFVGQRSQVISRVTCVGKAKCREPSDSWLMYTLEEQSSA